MEVENAEGSQQEEEGHFKKFGEWFFQEFRKKDKAKKDDVDKDLRFSTEDVFAH